MKIKLIGGHYERTWIPEDFDMRLLKETRRLCGLDYSSAACKRSISAYAELTPTEQERYEKNLLNGGML